MAVLKDNGCAISSKQHFSIAKGNYAISTLIYLEKLTLIRKTASKNIYGMRLMHLTKMLMISLGYGPSSLNLGPGLIDATYLLVDAHILVKCC